MTKETEKEKYGLSLCYTTALDVINDFQSRTCENCKHSGWHDGLLCAKQVCSNVTGGIDNHPYVETDFGCNKFERKEDDK